jgi:hypothetical protein
MIRIALISAFATSTALGAFAQEASHSDADLSVEVALPARVAEHVAELRDYGDRFEKAIRQIEAQADRPSWSWDECESSAGPGASVEPES